MEEHNEIKSLTEQVLQNFDLFLVDIELKGSQGNRIVWIFVESEHGNVSLDACAEVSRELEFLLDAAGWRGKKYTLNVSSPGLDRPLKDIRQYVNNLGRKATVIYEKSGENVQEEGKLVSADGDSIVLQKDSKQQISIPFENIVETRIQPVFNKQ